MSIWRSLRFHSGFWSMCFVVTPLGIKVLCCFITIMDAYMGVPPYWLLDRTASCLPIFCALLIMLGCWAGGQHTRELEAWWPYTVVGGGFVAVTACCYGASAAMRCIIAQGGLKTQKALASRIKAADGSDGSDGCVGLEPHRQSKPCEVEKRDGQRRRSQLVCVVPSERRESQLVF